MLFHESKDSIQSWQGSQLIPFSSQEILLDEDELCHLWKKPELKRLRPHPHLSQGLLKIWKMIQKGRLAQGMREPAQQSKNLSMIWNHHLHGSAVRRCGISRFLIWYLATASCYFKAFSYLGLNFHKGRYRKLVMHKRWSLAVSHPLLYSICELLNAQSVRFVLPSTSQSWSQMASKQWLHIENFCGLCHHKIFNTVYKVENQGRRLTIHPGSDWGFSAWPCWYAHFLSLGTFVRRSQISWKSASRVCWGKIKVPGPASSICYCKLTRAGSPIHSRVCFYHKTHF